MRACVGARASHVLAHRGEARERHRLVPKAPLLHERLLDLLQDAFDHLLVGKGFRMSALQRLPVLEPHTRLLLKVVEQPPAAQKLHRGRTNSGRGRQQRLESVCFHVLSSGA